MTSNGTYVFNCIFCIGILIFIITGCSTPSSNQGEFIDCSFYTLKQKISDEDTFILQFSKSNCPYCKALEKIEKEYLIENNVKIYRYAIDLHQEEYNKNQSYFEEHFPDLETVPSVYWIKKGTLDNELPIIEENQYSILQQWIHDNQIYNQ